jgi:hypothetical protein
MKSANLRSGWAAGKAAGEEPCISGGHSHEYGNEHGQTDPVSSYECRQRQLRCLAQALPKDGYPGAGRESHA